MSLILYVDRNRISPYALSAFVALSEKRVSFTVQDVDLDAGAARQPPFSTLSLTQRVPAIDHDGFVLTESNAIADYLDDVVAAPDYPSVLPRDVRQRARARQVLRGCAAICCAAQRARFHRRVPPSARTMRRCRRRRRPRPPSCCRSRANSCTVTTWLAPGASPTRIWP